MLATIGVKYYRSDPPRWRPLGDGVINKAVDTVSWHFVDITIRAEVRSREQSGHRTDYRKVGS
jgi:hypothetical protein